ncbi:nicotinamide riboside transporter pnuC [Neisseria sp. HMSC072F04]|jgi:nicotinamide mononucleotide transporter pnuC|nr:nicotinamide riboside transporter pnuC [Neisseria sp. HMSC072F04]
MSLAWWKRELFGGWTHFEAVWLLMFLGIQAVVFVFNPDSWLASIAAVTGILCVVFVGKGKISNYLFGLISVSLYAYVSYTFKLYGEMMLNLLVYVPVQFVGFAMWRKHMALGEMAETEEVKAKALTVRQWLLVVAASVVGTSVYIEWLHHLGSALPTLDGVTVVVSIVAQVLMILRYREQWALWIVVNILTISLWTAAWLKNGETSLPLLLMYVMYLCNSVYGYINWTKLVKRYSEQ